MVYDLVIVGNGIAAQTFLWSLGKKNRSDAKKSQTFSVAHIFSEKRAPACSLRSTASVSLNGIEEDVSPLGDDLRESFFLFENLYRQYSPPGIIPVKQTFICSNESDKAKLVRRFKSLISINNNKFNQVYSGFELNSYLINTAVYGEWLQATAEVKTTAFELFVKGMTIDESGHYQLTLEDNQTVQGKKVLLAMGAHSKIFSSFIQSETLPLQEDVNTIKAGSFLQRSIDLGDESFLLTIDNHQFNYRAEEKNLFIGSAMTIGAFEAPDVRTLKSIFEKCQSVLSFSIGNFNDYQMHTGLRHKGPRRKFIARRLHPDHQVWQVNGLYKNGYTLSLIAAQKLAEEIKL